MMRIEYLNPTYIIIPNELVNNKILKSLLTYKNLSVEYQLKKVKKMQSTWGFRDPVGYNKYIDELKSKLYHTLLYCNNDGVYYTYSGLLSLIQQTFHCDVAPYPFKVHIKHLLPLQTELPPLRDYQQEAIDILMQHPHGAIQLPTGSGKSRIIMELLKRNPVKTLIITPYSAITEQLYRDINKHFGSKYCGIFKSTNKNYKKLFVIANGQTVTRVKPDTEAYRELSNIEMFIADESQFISVDTFEAIANGVAVNAPLRYFFSATQTRVDGTELKLRGLIGNILYSLSFKDLSDRGYLKKIKTFIIQVPPAIPEFSDDPKIETQRNLYDNEYVYKNIAKIVYNMFQKGRQVLILIDEYKQFIKLQNYLTVEYAFLHGKVTSDVINKIDKQYLKVDTQHTIDEFNNGRIPCLIGTSSISTGVDLKPVGALIYFRGGKSEIQVIQSIGRGTRPVKHNTLYVFDFMVKSPILQRHCEYRMKIYAELSETVQMV